MTSLLFLDIEADNLLRDATKIWCIVGQDADTNIYHIYLGDTLDIEKDFCYPNECIYYDNIDIYLSVISKYKIVGHNIISYDLPLLSKLHSFTYSLDNVVDTHILSRLYYPDRDGHSISYYGDLLKLPKGDYNDFSHLSLDMLSYCIRDVEVLRKTYNFLENEANGWDWTESTKLEYRVWDIINRQELHGVLFDVAKARELVITIGNELSAIETTAYESLPLFASPIGVDVKKPFKKDGTLSASCASLDYAPLISGPFTKIEWNKMNFNSSAQVKEYFYKHGWEPTEWNYKKNPKTGFVEKDEDGNPIKTSPKLTEDSFDSIEGDLPRLLAKRNILIHRKRLIENVRKTDGEETGWLNNLREDNRISAGAIPNATNTGRMRHFNVVNVPSVDKLYGHDIRSLFTVPESYSLVGVDASALEARMQAHYVIPFKGGQELAELLLTGDIHQANADMWGCTRKQAKSPYYCLMYGGQPPKLAETMGCSLRDAQHYYNMFWNQYTPLTSFKDAVTTSWEKRGGKKGGFLKAIDGRKLFARSPHALVNMMFQSAGSITVKVATVLTDNYIRQKDLDAHQVIHMHDEFQIECLTSQADMVQYLSLRAFEVAGRYLKLNIPIVGEAKVGNNWADTH